MKKVVWSLIAGLVISVLIGGESRTDKAKAENHSFFLPEIIFDYDESEYDDKPITVIDSDEQPEFDFLFAEIFEKLFG